MQISVSALLGESSREPVWEPVLKILGHSCLPLNMEDIDVSGDGRPGILQSPHATQYLHETIGRYWLDETIGKCCFAFIQGHHSDDDTQLDFPSDSKEAVPLWAQGVPHLSYPSIVAYRSSFSGSLLKSNGIF